MGYEDLERLYGEKILTESELENYRSPNEQPSFNNSIGIVKGDFSSGKSVAFRFNLGNKSPEEIFKYIIANTTSVIKKVGVSEHDSEDHVEWLDKSTGFSYFDFNATTNTFLVALSVWYAFHMETSFGYREIQNFFAKQIKDVLEITPEKITMLQLIMDEKMSKVKNIGFEDNKKEKIKKEIERLKALLD